ncbi:glycosyltransferase family 39 protein [Rhizobium pusense]|uniref:ArnT family glycosyltransferase n=1 Tax=Agrobacterium pusense TaxID=648995 RepID=UPI00130034A9|nr:glycosyltransferase family 39 protein [Agrobacterium pusense]MDH0910473.1 glycosyltransferase family 39 protein [Agrobacterium pusense]MDH1098412.1 glycosyltransferase family 39 protein [Agrobacterium pusense]MDH1114522.1 glycosyltransferase family 39 protein [Agrobacterium pusense]MDH2195714.1 glycosyltransferase family 39 protein [Agrobacterium pusense]
MIEPLERQPVRIFGLLAAYFVLQIVVRLALPASLELDEAQQVFLSQWLSAGYDTQPPLYNWLQYGIISVFGVSVASLTVPKNILLFLSYLFFGLTAFNLIRDRRLGTIATLGLLTIPQISFEAQRDLTHTVAVIFATSFFLFSFFGMLKRPSARAYLLTGAAIGIGILSKYNFVLLPISLFLAASWEGSCRMRIFDRRILLTGGAAFLIVVYPHGLWFIDHMNDATASTITKMAEEAPPEKIIQVLRGLGSVVAAALGFSTVTIIVFAAAFKKDFLRALTNGSQWTRLFERSWFVAAIMLFAIVFFLGAVEIRSRWLTPLLLALPLYLGLKLEATGTISARAFRRFIPVSLTIMLLVPFLLAARIVLSGWIGSYDKLNVPYGPMVEHLIGRTLNQPAAIFAGDVQLAGNIRLHAPDIPVMAPQYPDFSPDIPLGKPMLLIWRERRSGAPVPEVPEDLIVFTAESLRSRIDVGEVGLKSLPYHYGGSKETYTFSYAWIRRSSVTQGGP